MHQNNRPGNRWRKHPGILTGGLFMLMVLLSPMSSCTSEKPAPPPQPASERKAKMEEIRLTEIQEGVKKWVLVAKRAKYLKDQHLIKLTGVQVEIFWKKGVNIKLTGNTGYINTQTRELTLKGQIQATAAEYQFEASQVSYIPKQRALVAKGAVKIHGPQVIIQGEDLKVELDKKSLVLATHKLTRCRIPEKIWLQ